ncbi:MAG: hypothetical protein KJO79_05290, partial [Verrucomicrobiae bacterium]|nr:hypothetical protein [Verrucomicrobiae bacterium]NNJ86574.1 hypothetical protein [Akkermansiaceae bacterium]
QNICAFFKRHDDGDVTLDWPVFVQTRYRLLEEFVSNPHLESRRVFRLLTYRINPVLVENIYSPHITDHDWYYIHCPGYDKERYVVAVARQSPAGIMMKQRFEQGARNAVSIHAMTAELTWKASQKDGMPVMAISDIVCWEFHNLNSGK